MTPNTTPNASRLSSAVMPAVSAAHSAFARWNPSETTEPLLWLVNSRGYDVHTLRRLESENERTIRELKEALDEERKRSEILTQAIRGVGR